MGVGDATPARDLVFVSYSHQDQEFLRRLLVLLRPVVRNRRLQVWVDEYILAGDDWRREIGGAVDRAAVGLLLVSADFLASQFIIEEELPALIERGVPLVPVLVRDCLWQHEPLLERMQWAHDPDRVGPLDVESDRERDRLLVQICEKLIALPAGTGDAVARPGSTACRRCRRDIWPARSWPGWSRRCQRPAAEQWG
jgi:hypothetical protein